MIKRIIAGTISAVLCTSAASTEIAVYAAGKDDTSTAASDAAVPTENEPVSTANLGENITAYIYDDGTVVIRGYGEMSDFRSSPFAETKMERVIFENEDTAKGLVITSIGANTFKACGLLTSLGEKNSIKDNIVAIPDSVRTIGDNAFADCTSISQLELGSGAETLGKGAFSGCLNLTALTVPENVTSMGIAVFGGCIGLKELTLPYAATNAENAETGEVNPDCSVADLFYDQHWNWENSAADFSAYRLRKLTVTGGKTVPQYAFARMASLTEIDLSGTPVTDIGGYAFFCCSELKSIKLPSTLKNIGNSAFSNCFSVTGFDIPDGTETIGQYTFAGCKGISSLVIPDTVTSMGRMCFNGCTELTELSLPYAATDAVCAAADGPTDPDNSVTDLFYDQHWNWENRDFDSSVYKLTKIIVRGGEKVPQYAFANMQNLKEIDLSGAPTASVDGYAFSNCTSLTEVKLPETLTNIGDYAYCATPITEFPDNGKIKTLGSGVFADCTELRATTLPDSYETLGQYVFKNCTGITSFVVPKNVTEIGRMSFSGCTELTELTLPFAGTNAAGASTEGSVDPDCSVTDLFYDQHWNWENRDFDSSPYKLTKLTIYGGEKIPQYAFANMQGLTEIDLSSSFITDIDNYAFNDCTALTDIKLPSTLKNIKTAAFRNCSSVKQFNIPDGTDTIGEWAFSNCTGISSLVIPDSVTSMGRMMLNGCCTLETLTLPYAATSAECAAADGSVDPDCSVADLFIDQHWNWENDAMDFSTYGISKIVITDGEKIPRYAFSDMRTLREVDICGADTASVEEYAFNNCTAIEAAEIPESVKTIAPNAFAGTDPDLYIYGKDTELAENALSNNYTGTIHGYKKSSADTFAETNEFDFKPLDGEAILSPSSVSMAIGDKYTIKTGVKGITFSSSDKNVAAVDKNGVISAASAGNASITAKTSDGKEYMISVTVRPPVTLYTLGDVNEDGMIDAKDASLVLVEYSKASTGGNGEFIQAQKKASDVNSDGMTDAKDASLILSYYSYVSTNSGSALTLEEFLRKTE
ncbi:MAG: leucine-rich repeat protein [Ruminococcus sp.]|nr:leucine-rich repeat protein [Ruminococcus sp.]